MSGFPDLIFEINERIDAATDSVAPRPKRSVKRQALATTAVRPPRGHDKLGSGRIFASEITWSRIAGAPAEIKGRLWEAAFKRDPFACIVKARMKAA